MSKRLTSIVTAVVLMFVFTATAFAATTETFYGGYSTWDTEGSIVVELTNISSKENVILSETEAEVYFDDAEILNYEIDYDYDDDKVITIKDILEYYNNDGGVPTYYAEAAPVVVTAKTAMRTFFFSYRGENIKYTFEPKYYSDVEYYYDYENRQVYSEKPEDGWLYADGTTITLNEPGKYIFVFTDDGLVSSSPAGLLCVHIADTPSESPVPETKEINVNPTTSTVLVNGKAVEFEAYNIDGYNYFKLRDLAQAVNNTEKNFEVTWDGVNNAINLFSNTPYTPVGGELVKGDGTAKIATPTTSRIYKDGEEISLIAFNIEGYNYFKLRDIAKIFDIGVTWDGANNTIIIDTSISYVEE